MPLLSNSNKRKPQSANLQRRCGMSRLDNPESLLSNFKQNPFKLPRVRLPIESIEDPPQSTDDEDGTAFSQAKISAGATPPAPRPVRGTRKADSSETLPSQPSPIVSSSEDEMMTARGNIKITKFTGKTATGSPKTSSRLLTSPARRSKRLRLERSSSKATISDADFPSSSGEHLRDEHGFTKTRKSKTTYGRRAGSQESRGGQGKRRGISTTLRVPDKLSSPENDAKRTLRVPPRVIPSSSPPYRTAKKKDVFSNKGKGSRTSIDELANPSDLSRTSTPAPPRKRKLKQKAKSPPPARATLIIPASISQLDLRAPRCGAPDEAPLPDSFLDSDDNGSEQSCTETDQPSDDPATSCPWCGELVDKTLLDGFAKGRRLTVHLQTKFCDQHKKRSAKESWRRKGYPGIEWDALHQRFAAHHALMLDIINGRESHFRSMHQDNIARGKARSLKKEENLTPGYYGPRGFNAMCDHLVAEFGDLLKEKAVSDKVIAGRGTAAFIQTVLVAELAVRLIMEDLDLSEDDARIALEESKTLGELLHGDV